MLFLTWRYVQLPPPNWEFGSISYAGFKLTKTLAFFVQVKVKDNCWIIFLIFRASLLFGNSPAITHSCCNSIFHPTLIHHIWGKRAREAVDRTRENLNTREFQDLPPPFLSLTAFCGNKLRPRSSPSPPPPNRFHSHERTPVARQEWVLRRREERRIGGLDQCRTQTLWCNS